MSMQPVGPSPALHVRAAGEPDVPFLVDVVLVTARAQGRVDAGFDEQAWRTAFAAETLRQVTGEVEHDTTYVIEVDGERAGRLRLVRPPEVWELAGIHLLPAHQGHGHGTHLVEQFLVDARERGLAARTSVPRDNPRARRLFERLGFVEVDGTGDDVRMDLMEWHG